jgi:hypothetical protein
MFLILYSVWVIYLSCTINIGEDETYTLNTTSYNLPTVISQSYHFEDQPPMYFILLSLWRHINSGIFFLRFFSFISIAIAAFVFYRIAVLISGTDYSKWMLILFLLNPFSVWAALEMRLYALLLLLSTLSVYFFFRFFLENRKKYLYLFLVTSAIGMYTQYFFTFLIIALLFSFSIFKGLKAFWKLCLYMIPFGVIFLPNLIQMSNSLEKAHNFELAYSLTSRLLDVLKSIPKLILGLNIILVGNGVKIIIILFSLAFVIFSYITLYKRNKISIDNYFERINFILISIFILILLFTLSFASSGFLYADRYMTICFPLFILLYTMIKVHSYIFTRFIYSLITIYFITLHIFFYSHPVKELDYKSFADVITRIERPNEPILFYRNGISLPFKYSYQGTNSLVPLPNKVTFDNNYLTNIKDTLELKYSIDRISNKSTSYLLITDDLTNYLGHINMNRLMVDNYFNLHYIITKDTLFYNKKGDAFLRIRRLENR